MLNSVVCPIKEDTKEKETDIPGVPSKSGSGETGIRHHTKTSPEDGIFLKHQEKSADNIAASNQKALVLSSPKQCTSSNNDDLDLDLDLNDDNDGFRTPTSLDHRIPAMKQCPPPPRKRSVVCSRKRKQSSPLLMRTTLQLLDVSQEIIHSMFPQREDKQHKIKKARN